ncbi:unnamed protein product [Symbiodinium natans]|uniref:Uncharacterized protein n=1 Tax=Symbiodinium natans TaxID=878477 RepID=A0A812T0Q4_9DINO|nr:unnamed protein product [Symbiodinium natans]
MTMSPRQIYPCPCVAHMLPIVLLAFAVPSASAARAREDLRTELMLDSDLTPECQAELHGLITDLTQNCIEFVREKFGDGEESCGPKISEWLTGNLKTSEPKLTTWTQSLAKSEKEGMLWAGFWDGGEAERTSKEALFRFAKLINRITVHPSTTLGRLTAKNGDLQECNEDPAVYTPLTGEPTDKGLLPNFWMVASEWFVHEMARKEQSAIVMLVNKDLDPEANRNLYQSVLWKYELPALADRVRLSAAEFFAGWEPQVVLVNMQDSCIDLKGKIAGQLRNVVLGPENQWIERWLANKPIICLECASPCELNQKFADDLQEELNRKSP